MSYLSALPRLLLTQNPRLLLRSTTLHPSTTTQLLLLHHQHQRHASSSAAPDPPGPPPRTLSEQFRRRQQQQQQQQRFQAPQVQVPPRPASSSPAQPVMPQPDKYRPPSHGTRISRSGESGQPRSYGPALTEEDRKRMRTKKYPNMMAPEGTFMHWFLNSRWIHGFITLSILFSLAAWAFCIDTVNRNPYTHLFPARKDFLRHPIESGRRAVDVYLMGINYQTGIAVAMQEKKAEDVEKRKLFRKEQIRLARERGEEWVDDQRYYVGEDGVRRRRVKRWFGIWE